MKYPHATEQPLEQQEVVLNLWAYVFEDVIYRDPRPDLDY